MSLIRLKHISKRCLIRDVSETSQKHLSQAFVIFQKYPTKMVSCDLRRFVTISDKIDVGQLETPTKFYIFWEQFIYFNQVCHEHIGLISAWEFWQVNDRQSLIVCVVFTTLNDFLRLIKLCITNPLSLWTVLQYRNLIEVA